MQNNKSAAVRNARTAVTSAQNAGRQNTFNRAEEMGITIQKEWISTHDGRVRDSHAALDGVRVNNDRPFPNGLRYPGDPSGAPAEVYNCRCTMRSIIPKYNDAKRTENTSASYAAWVFEKIKGSNFTRKKPETSSKIGQVLYANSYSHKGKTYTIDGINVKHTANDREKEIAQFYSEKYGHDVTIIPVVNGKYPYVSTPDYTIDNVRVDLKEIKTKGKDVIYNAIKKSLRKDQAQDFIIDISSEALSENEAAEEIAKLFNRTYCAAVNSVDLIKNNEILWRYIRK